MKKLTILLSLFCLVHSGYSQTISTVAGNGYIGYSGDGGYATASTIFIASGVAVDAGGNMYIADFANYRIRKVSSTGIISTVAGNGTNGFSGDGGPATAATMRAANSVAVDGSGNIYFTDSVRIRKVNTSGIISTIAGTGTNGFSGDGGPATSAALNSPYGINADGSGNVYICDQNNNRVRMVNTSGIINTIAGNGTAGYSGDGMAATATKLYHPMSVAFDGGGNIYIADGSNNRIRKINSSGIISTVAGVGSGGYTGDGGPATAAKLLGPLAICVDASGNLYIGDGDNYVVRKVNTAGIITTYAGDNDYNYYGDGGPATDAAISIAGGLDIDAAGNLFIADVWNNMIRKVNGCLPTVAAISGSSSLCAGATLTLTDATTGGTWSSSSSSSVATVSSAGVVTGVAGGSAIISYSVTNSCGTVSATWPLTVSALPNAGIISGTDTICQGTTATFTDTVTGGTWSTSSATIASVSGTGVVTGVAAGIVTISYSVTNTCGTTRATASVVILSHTACAANVQGIGIESGICIFPNPAHDVLSIEVPGNEDADIYITDVYGRKVRSITITDKSLRKNPVNINGLSPGVYLVKVASGVHVFEAKIIVQ